MALSKLFGFFEALKHHFLDWCRPKGKNDFSILITGKSGVGKSSLINALVGKEVTKEERKRKHCTDEVTSYSLIIEGVAVRVWDSSGIQDGEEGNEKLRLAEIKEMIKGELDLVIFCLKMDDARFYPEDKKSIQILTEAFGKELWNNAVIALTFANKIEDPRGGDQDAFFSEEIENWKEEINSFFTDRIKIDSKLSHSPPLVPTGYHRQRPSLPDRWLPKFWSACYNVARNSAAFNLYRMNIGRLRFSETEEYADADCGETDVVPSFQGADDSEDQMPEIILNEEEQDSFWKKTWEMLKEYGIRGSVIWGVMGTVGFTSLKMIN